MRKKNTTEARLTWKIKCVEEAKNSAQQFLCQILSNEQLVRIVFGLPEVDDRYMIWRVPVLSANHTEKIGEIVLEATTGDIQGNKTTKADVLIARLTEYGNSERSPKRKKRESTIPALSMLPNTVALGDAEEVLANLPECSIDLVFTSPPYFNARPEYSDYVAYNDNLEKMRKIIRGAHRIMNEGRFFVINVSPVLLRRASRNEASRRIAVPFDFHRLFIEEGFDFIDDIIWEKPEGAGWATGRGRRFAADRNPLQYKPVPVTEYVLVYRKHTDKLIDWHIRKHPRQEDVERSKIQDDYQKTNIWKITPAHSKKHPAIFPEELAENVIKYYSFTNDVVLDPFGGSGTTARVAHRLQRRFAHIELSDAYMNDFKSDITSWFSDRLESVNWINTEVPFDDRLEF